MPIAGDYTWTETNASIEVVISLKGVSPKKVDVFTASTILKVSYSPFLIDLDLFDEIELDKCKAIFKDGVLKILLVKKIQELWGQLCFGGTIDETKQRRQQALEKRQQHVKEQIGKVRAKKFEEERMVFHQHMELERKERQRIDDVKAQEKWNAEEAMYKTFSNLETMKVDVGKLKAPKPSSDELVPSEVSSETIEPPQDCARDTVQEAEEYDNDLPPPRAVSRSTFRHTPRFFKTPARESCAKQEQEFILKNRASLKTNKLLNVEKIEETDPIWLKEKGDEFKRRGDYSSAINAYSDAIDADRGMIDVIASRGACYLQLRQGDSCIKDCLDVLGMKGGMISQFPEVERRVRFEKGTRVRLGMAYCLVKEHDNARAQFEEARELDKNDRVIEKCIDYLEVLVRASGLKGEADQLFAQGSFSDAVDTYTKAIKADPMLLTALINRAACHLATKNSSCCIRDCTDALDFLSAGKHRLGSNVLALLLFPDSQTKRKWTVTLLSRRAAAKQLDMDSAGSLDDLEQALHLANRDVEIDSSGIERDISALKLKLSDGKN